MVKTSKTSTARPTHLQLHPTLQRGSGGSLGPKAQRCTALVVRFENPLKLTERECVLFVYDYHTMVVLDFAR